MALAKLEIDEKIHELSFLTLLFLVNASEKYLKSSTTTEPVVHTKGTTGNEAEITPTDI